MDEIIKARFLEQTGKKAKTISKIGFNQWIIETEDKETYRLYY